MKVLIIDDDKMQVEHVSAAVSRCGFDSDATTDGKTGCLKLLKGGYDVAFVDIELKLYDGKEILRQAHAKKLKTYLFVLSSHASEADRLSGFAMGADEYLAKPVSIDEIVARLRAIERRLQPSLAPEILMGAGMVFNVTTQEVRRNGRFIDLTPREKKLLALLMRNKGRPVALDTIVEYVWGDGIDPNSTVAQANISRLRKKLRIGDEDEVIHTMRDIGYVFK